MSFDFADVKPSIISWVIVGLMAMTFIIALKVLTARYPVPGLSDLVQAV